MLGLHAPVVQLTPLLLNLRLQLPQVAVALHHVAPVLLAQQLLELLVAQCSAGLVAVRHSLRDDADCVHHVVPHRVSAVLQLRAQHGQQVQQVDQRAAVPVRRAAPLDELERGVDVAEVDAGHGRLPAVRFPDLAEELPLHAELLHALPAVAAVGVDGLVDAAQTVLQPEVEEGRAHHHAVLQGRHGVDQGVEEGQHARLHLEVAAAERGDERLVGGAARGERLHDQLVAPVADPADDGQQVDQLRSLQVVCALQGRDEAVDAAGRVDYD